MSGGSPAGRSLLRPGLSPDLQRSELGRYPAGVSSSPQGGIRCARSREAFRGFGTEDGNWAFHTVSVAGTLPGKPQAGGQCGGGGLSVQTADGQEMLGAEGDGTVDTWWHACTHPHTRSHRQIWSKHTDRNTHAHSHTHTHTHTHTFSHTGKNV